MEKWYAIAYKGDRSKEFATGKDYGELLENMDKAKEQLQKEGYEDWEVKTR